MRKTILGGRYVLGEQVGQGGMGVVHVAEDLTLVERVAVKLLHAEHAADGIEASNLLREARIGRLIRHPNVVAVIDAGLTDGRPFLVMELIAGCRLREEAARKRTSRWSVIDLVTQILSGLDAIHRAGFVHGDLKSDNVLCGDGPDRAGVATIIDLGLARSHVNDAGPLDRRTVSGTPDYIAPEVSMGGDKTVASDLYAVGVILYELLTGSTPFGGGRSIEILLRHTSDAVVPPSVRCPELKISIATERVVLQALAKRPDARFPDARAFAAALDASVAATRPDRAPRVPFSSGAPTIEWSSSDVVPVGRRRGKAFIGRSAGRR